MNFLENAHRLGLRIARAAVWDGELCTWTQTLPAAPTRPAGPFFYSGTAGIGVFLAHLHARTGCAESGRAARGAIRQALAAADDLGPRDVGAYFGRAGIALAAAWAARALDDEALRDGARRIIVPLDEHVSSVNQFDTMSGAAGVVSALLAMRAEIPGADTLALAFGERLLARAKRGPIGWSWRTWFAAVPLVGLAHGASGCVHAFLQLFNATGDDRFLYGAEQGLAYERSHFDANVGNWPDLRYDEADAYIRRDDRDGLRAALAAGQVPPYRASFTETWCHGAPGIALVRLLAMQTLNSEALRAEARTALAATQRALTSAMEKPVRCVADLSLCHGIAGLVEVLRTGAMTLGDPHARERVEETARAMFDRVETELFAAAPVDSGLMVGESGIGWAMLALHDGAVPSVLLPAGRRNAGIRESSSGLTALSRADAEAWFGRISRILARIGIRVSNHGELEPQATLSGLEEWLAHAPNDTRERVADALGPELARHAAATRLQLEAWCRPTCREAPSHVRRRPGVQLVRSQWDWDAWLATTSDASPASVERWYAVVPTAADARLVALQEPEATLTLAAFRSGAAVACESRMGRRLVELGVLDAAQPAETAASQTHMSIP